jgi:GDP-L-fucose synthase
MASNILVLGASGFVGGVVSKQLQNHYTVYSPTRQELDLTNYQSVLNYFSNNNIDVVIHCAGNVDSNLANFDVNGVSSNLLMFSNLYAVRSQYAKLINIGSGAEFDRSTHINQLAEEMIFTSTPTDHYGLSKNIISRIVATTENFYTLRLFGVFGTSESHNRLLKKVICGQEIQITDRYFDYFYINDIIPILEHYINFTPKHKDINVVYSTKIQLSNFLTEFCKLHNLSGDNIKLSSTTGLNYTGSSNRIEELQLPFVGLTQGLKDYI